MTDKESLMEEIIDASMNFKEGSDEEKYLMALANSLDKISEKEIGKWIASNREGITKFVPDNTKIYELANSKEPRWRNTPLNLEEIFNDKDILHNWNNPEKYSKERLAGIAKANGISLSELEDELKKQSLIESRKESMYPEWAFGHSIMNPIINFLQSTLTPRLYEKRLREGIDADLFHDDKGNFDPSLLLDVGENALYAVPYGKVASTAIKPIGAMINAGGKTGAIAKTGLFLGENTANPLIMEVADDIAYDDPNNERSEFSTADVFQGTGVNMAAPVALKTGVAGMARVFNGSGKPDRGLMKTLYEIGEGSADDVMAKIRTNNKRYDQLQAKALTYGVSDLDEAEKAFLKSYPRYELNDEILEEIFKMEGSTFKEKVGNYLKSSQNKGITLELEDNPFFKNLIEGDGIKYRPYIVKKPSVGVDDVSIGSKSKEVAEELLPALENSPYRELNDKSLKTQKKIMEENAAKNFITNKYGDTGYDGDQTSSIPLIGPIVDLIKLGEAEEQEEEAKNDATKRYRINFMLGN